MSEVNVKDVTLKSYSLKIETNSVNQILRDNEKITETCNINIPTTITDQKILCVYSWGPGPYNSLYQADNRKYFSGLSLTWIERKYTCSFGKSSEEKFGDIVAEKKVTLSWLLNSNMVKPEKFEHLDFITLQSI